MVSPPGRTHGAKTEGISVFMTACWIENQHAHSEDFGGDENEYTSFNFIGSLIIPVIGYEEN